MDLEERLNYLKEVSSFTRITVEDRHINVDMDNVYKMIRDNITETYGVSNHDLQKDVKIRQFQYDGLVPMQYNMNLGYDEHKIIGNIT